MTTLPDDIVLYSILPWLPSKSLLRFRCVCKSWDSFIRHPWFLHLRKLTNNTTHHLLLLSPHPQPSQAPYPADVYCAPHPNNSTVTRPLHPSLLFTLPIHYSTTRVQCVNGLLCFNPRSSALFCYGNRTFTLIANPTTRQVLTLPLDHSLPLRTNSSFKIYNHFGYDPVRDEFKVLRFVNYQTSHEVKVFTLGGDTSWRRVVTTPERPLSLMRPHLLFSSVNKKIGLCVNGALYWTCHDKINMHVNGAIHSTGLLIFDLGTEQFSEMPAPSGYSYKEQEENAWHWKYPDLVEIDGCLCLVEYSGFDLKLWILRDCEAQVWEQKSVVLPSGVVSQQQVVFFPLCRVPTGEILLLLHIVDGRLRGVYYDMETKSSRSVVVMDSPHVVQPYFRSGEVDIVFCQESFRLLK